MRKTSRANSISLKNTVADYPEHDKLRAVRDESQAIGQFLEWLGENGLVICSFEEYKRTGEYIPDGRSIQQILADYFEIDLNKLDDEKRAMLNELRKANGDDGEDDNPT